MVVEAKGTRVDPAGVYEGCQAMWRVVPASMSVRHGGTYKPVSQSPRNWSRRFDSWYLAMRVGGERRRLSGHVVQILGRRERWDLAQYRGQGLEGG